MDYQRARKTSEKEERRAAILNAAKGQFASAGFESANIDRISADCGLSRSLIYTYYLDKTHLFVAVVSEALELLHGEFQTQVAHQRTGIETLASIGRAYVDFALRRPEYYEAILRFRFEDVEVPLERNGKKDALLDAFRHDLELVRDRARDIDTLLEDQIRRGMRDGTLRPVQDPRQVARALRAMTAGLIRAAAGDWNLLEAGLDIATSGLRAEERK